MENNKEPFNGLSEEKLKIFWEQVNFPCKYGKKPPFETGAISPIAEPDVPDSYRPIIWEKGAK